MKDFKTLPKMKTGGKVKKYDDGGSVIADYKKYASSGKDVDPGIMAPSKPRKINLNGEDVELKPVPMPMSPQSDTINVPGIGRVPRPATKTTLNNAALLKKGGKVKRGKVTKK